MLIQTQRLFPIPGRLCRPLLSMLQFDLINPLRPKSRDFRMAASSSAQGRARERTKPLWKYPCSTCDKPVMCNQKGLCCDYCDRCSHTRCSGVSDAQYEQLSDIGISTSWYCSACTFYLLPYAGSSLVSDVASFVSDNHEGSDSALV